MTTVVRWTQADAERYLLSLELFGMRFGLDRMRRLLGLLGSPQERFSSIHVVGTNGKSSTARMIAAILERHGLRTGAYLSPHLASFTERIRIGERDVVGDDFARAVARSADAAAQLDRSAAPGDHVTQFEALTAAAYYELARAGVDVAVVEAGLGGRFDATNVIASSVQVLTNVGLEHTRWLGTEVSAIATEKLDVVQPGATLVVGADLHPDARAVAESVALERGATLMEAPPHVEGIELLARGAYQRRNFAVARAAAHTYLGELDDAAVRAAAEATSVPGRFEVVAERPTTVLDGAHNPDGFTALAEALPALAAGRRVVAVLSVLDDKDAEGMLRRLGGRLDEIVFTTTSNPRAIPAEQLQSLTGRMSGPPSRCVPDPRAAVELARRLAGEDGVVLVTGSIYLIADLVRPADAGPGATL